MIIRLIKLIIRRINLLRRKSSRICQGQLKLKLKLTAIWGSLYIRPRCWLRPCTPDCAWYGRPFSSARVCRSELAAPRRSGGSRCLLESQARDPMQRNVSLLSNKQRKRSADFISSSRWMGDFQVLKPNPLLARRGPAACSLSAAVPGPRRQGR